MATEPGGDTQQATGVFSLLEYALVIGMLAVLLAILLLVTR